MKNTKKMMHRLSVLLFAVGLTTGQIVMAQDDGKIDASRAQEEVTMLKEVEIVSIGMGTARREDLTGAISSIKAEDMKQGVITSAEQLLQSKIAGLTIVQGSGDPASGAIMRLRGGTSLSGGNNPLIVVDGIVVSDMNVVPAADIISIDVLKDASASAIYGSRAANGVVLITTKRRGQESISASYTGFVSMSNASGRLDLLDANAFRAKLDEGSLLDRGGSTNWQDQIQRTALTHSHSASFNGNAKKFGFKGTVSYLNSEGVVKTSQLERIGANLTGFTTLVDDRLTLELSLSKTKDNYNAINQQELFMTTYQANPTWSVKNPDGSYFNPYYDPKKPSNIEKYNPLEILENRYANNTRDRFFGYLKTDIVFIKGKSGEGLKGTVNAAYNTVDEQQRFYLPIAAHSEGGKPIGMRGQATRAEGHYAQKQIEAYLTYDEIFQSVHKFNAMAGYSYAHEGGEGMGAGVRHFDYDDFLYNNLAAAKNLFYKNEAGEYQRQGAEYTYSYKDESAIASFFGRVNYSYASKYMITATLRADGSSKFGANHKWGFFPSASAAWRISQEKFLSGTQNWLNELKLRAGYGVTGNQFGIRNYQSLSTYTPMPRLDPPLEDGEVPPIAFVRTRNANPDLKWESTAQVNIGLDFELFKRRLSGTVEFYHKRTNDLLFFYQVGATAYNDIEYTLMNIGNLENTGVELSLNGTIYSNKNFSWEANLNLAHNKNKVTKLARQDITDLEDVSTPTDMGYIFNSATRQPYEGLNGAGRMTNTQILREGYSAGSFFGAKTAGLDADGNILYIVSDGYGGETTTTNPGDLTNADRNHYLGSAMSKLTLGFGMNFSYKKWDASINTYGMFGQKVYNATAMLLSSPPDHGEDNVLASSLGKNMNRCLSDYWLEDASFFRIQSLSIGYTFDLKKIKLNSLRLYATVENPFVFTSYSGVDPEVSIDMNVTEMDSREKVSPGIDHFNNYPRPRTFLLGVNIQF